jgi:hypothetical protein
VFFSLSRSRSSPRQVRPTTSNKTMVMHLSTLFKGYRSLLNVSSDIDGHCHSPSEGMPLTDRDIPLNEFSYRRRLGLSLYQELFTIMSALTWIIGAIMFVAALCTRQSDKDCIAQTTVWCKCCKPIILLASSNSHLCGNSSNSRSS